MISAHSCTSTDDNSLYIRLINLTKFIQMCTIYFVDFLRNFVFFIKSIVNYLLKIDLISINSTFNIKNQL